MRGLRDLVALATLLALVGAARGEGVVLFDGASATGWSSMRDRARMEREYVRHELSAESDPASGNYLAWQFRLREGGFADIFRGAGIPRVFDALRLVVRNRGASLALAVKTRDARGAEWTAPMVALPAGGGWQTVEFPFAQFAAASWSTDADGQFDFPATPLAVIAFQVGPGNDYALDIAEIALELPPPPRVTVQGLELPESLDAGQPFRGHLSLTVLDPLLDDTARLSFLLDGIERFTLPLSLEAAPTSFAPGTALEIAIETNAPTYAPGGRYVVELSLGCCRAEVAGRLPSEGIATMTYKERTPGTTVARVSEWNGAPTIVVNDTPLSGMAYMAYGPSREVFEQFAQEGVRLFSFSATPTESGYGLARTTWTGPEAYDYTQLDERAMMVLEACPDAWFFPRIYVHAPAWWSAEHPDDLVVQENADGTREVFSHGEGKPAPSWSSEAWRAATIEGIRKLIDHIEAAPWGDRVLGYHIASGTTEEWMMWGANESEWVDYSPANVAKFRAWLGARYGGDEALRRAWADPAVTLATAEIPTRAERARCLRGWLRDPARERSVIDFTEYNSWMVADTIRALAAAVKERTRGERLVGVFYGYLLQLIAEPRMQNAGHLALNEVLSCPDVDFVTSPTSYMFRDVARGTSHFMSLIASVRAHGKVWFDENDIRTSLSPGAVGEWGRPADVAGDILQQDRELGNVLANGCAQWWFDVGANRYDDPELMAHIGKLTEAAERAVACDRSAVDEIAVIVDGMSLAWIEVGARPTAWLVGQQIPELARIGAPVGYYTLEDLRTLAPRRMYVFLTAFAPTAAQREAVARLRSEGRVLVFVGPQGVFREGALEPSAMSDFAGIHLALEETAMPWRCSWERGSYGTDEAFAPSARPDDPEAETLGALADGRPGLVRRRFEEWTAVHSLAPTLPAGLLRSLAEEAGVHLYAPEGRVVWATRGLLSVWSPEAGACPIRLREPATVTDLVTGEVLGTGVSELTVPIGAAGTRTVSLAP